MEGGRSKKLLAVCGYGPGQMTCVISTHSNKTSVEKNVFPEYQDMTWSCCLSRLNLEFKKNKTKQIKIA